uniref:Glycosyltransferase n=1 Tax=Leersia perrieri TaxID=77586 RepID=A0A0D9UXJ1_9ORYZ
MPAAAMANSGEEMNNPPHFLVVTYPAQGHINPARHLALRLMRATGARVTLSTAVSAVRKMFGEMPEGEFVDGAGVRYAPYSDGYDDGFDRNVHDSATYMTNVRLVGARTLAGVLDRLRGEGRPVTRVVYTLLLTWVSGVAREHGVPSALYWIQPASVLAAYFHYFRDTDGARRAVAAAAARRDRMGIVSVPGLPPLRLRDLPSFITVADGDDDPYAFVLDSFRDIVDVLAAGESAPAVLANTFDAMEPEAVASLRRHGVDVIPIGPVLSFLDAGDGDVTAGAGKADLFKHDDASSYLDWLDTMPARSVVYISFGSLSTMSRRQIREVSRAMADGDHPFLWVLRKDNRGEDDDASLAAATFAADGGERRGVVVEWCDQVKVLAHPSVGCFVTHCGWNSTLEAVASGVPTVCVPQWTDQGTNAWIVVERLGVGVRAAVSREDGVLEADELARCIDVVTSEAVRGNAAAWREKARAAVADGGSSEMNLRAFVGKVGAN